MKKLFLFLFFISFFVGFSQNYDIVTLGDKVDKANKSITIPLYNVSIDGVDIPIFLSYNTKGFKVNDVPTSVGFNWKLNAGGTINKIINHLDDDNNDGWLNTPLPIFNIGDIFSSTQIEQIRDIAPDIYSMHLSNGDFLEYVYDKSRMPFIFKQSKIINPLSTTIKRQLPVFSEFQEEEEYNISIRRKDNIEYTFRKGVERINSWDLDRYSRRTPSTNYSNFYIHRIYSNTKQIFNFQYITTGLYKYILVASAKRVQEQTNSDPSTPPDYNDPIITETIAQRTHVLLQDVSRKEIKKIITPKETIEFTYITNLYFTGGLYGYSSNPDNILPDLTTQNINLLDEIKRFDNNGNYISGYQFFYDIQNQDNPLKLTHIIKYGKNHTNNNIYRQFKYYDEDNYRRPSAITTDKDVFDYYNGMNPNWDYPPILSEHTPLRFPNESEMISCMLKSVTNQEGAKTEYLYKENSFDDMYYGGLLISGIQKYDANNLLIGKINYTYENPEGFGLPIYDNWQQAGQGDFPPNMYEKGYFEEYFQGNTTWKTYFTKVLPIIQQPEQGLFPPYEIKSIPFALMKETDYTDNILYNLQLQSYPQIQKGSFYKKITKTVLNRNTDIGENGTTISYYRPNVSGFYLDKLLEKEEIINNNGIKILEKTFNYEDHVYDNFIQAYKFENAFSNSGYQNNIAVNDFKIYKIYSVLRNIEVNKYSDLGLLLENKKNEFTYLNEGLLYTDYTRIKTINKYHNDILYKRVENKYISEIDNIELFPDKEDLARNFNPIMEKLIWVKPNNNWKLSSATIRNFLLDGKVKKTGVVTNNITTGLKYTTTDYTHADFDSQGNLVSLMNNEIEYEYDEVNDKLIKSKDTETNTSILYQRSDEYKGLYIDAILTTTEDNATFLKKSFENKEESNVVHFNKAFSGNYVFNGNSISLGTYPVNYRISYWAYINNKWQYYSAIHTGGTVTITKPANALYIDEVRVQPKNATMQTFTFNPLIGKTSSLNDRGEGERIEYDIFNRPLFLLDKDHNVLKEYRYNIKQN